MDTSTEFTTWHIQCIYLPLKTTKAISRYIQNVNTFLERVWEESGEAAPLPPQLEVDAVENSVVTHRGASINAVRVRFRLPPEHRADNDTFHRAIRHLCERIFKLKAGGEICSDISLISSRSLIGIAPLSQWFKFYWTQGFLDTFVRRQVPLFNELADAEFFWPWLGGAAFVVLASDQKSSDILRGIKISLRNNLDFSARRPPRELEERSKQLSRKFLRSVEKLLRHVKENIEACIIAIGQGAAQVPSDFEIRLFNVVLEVFENGFEALTVNKEVFDEWEEIVSDAADRLRTAAVTAGAATTVSLGLLFGLKTGGASGAATVARAVRGIVGAITGAGTTGAATAGAAGAAGVAGGATLCSAAVLGPLALVAAASLVGFIHYRNYNKARGERNRIKKLSEEIRGYYDIACCLAQWFVEGHKPSQAGEAHEMQDMGAGLDTRGMTPTLSLRDYKASLSSVADVLDQQLQKMREDPNFKHCFS